MYSCVTEAMYCVKYGVNVVSRTWSGSWSF